MLTLEDGRWKMEDGRRRMGEEVQTQSVRKLDTEEKGKRKERKRKKKPEELKY